MSILNSVFSKNIKKKDKVEIFFGDIKAEKNTLPEYLQYKKC